MKNIHANKLGFWSAVFSAIFGMCYVLAQGADFLHLLGTGGGPVSLFFLMFPSFLLAFSFVIVSVCIHYLADDEKKVFSSIGTAFSIIYAVLIIIVYYTQLTLIIPGQLKGTAERLLPFVFSPFDSFLFALDVLGYGVMNLATLFFAFVFKRKGLEGWIFWFLFCNGILFFSNLLSMVCPLLLFFDYPWAVTFPGSMVLLAILFKRKMIYTIDNKMNL